MTITVEELRRKYPEPRIHPEHNGGYCVAWAFAAEWGSIEGNDTYIKVLARLTGMSEKEAEHIWLNIIHENDAGNFDVAWAWLDKGLSA